ncbi:molybdenum ABC transporter ATP-binding protein [Geobacillus thermocatenulatus]|uniref:Molybdenum ABC transporter ATP-binding protein n=1 Tax=Geobacillus thermocatenulatus TaxID=33938 RepID=A0A226Q2L4_9BACL|nr:MULTISPECIES: ABC transporter ATP-binding protein [Geobacillus]ASS99518.1 molybdenum ABC transporter ATP-binding protein [Geobacillus thermocatenulatus]KLR73031.1 molybdenum ABC transporter ATP-binding protein [Geobacillus sp. T6]OXB85920.1 molybdenum ABC transporter ATP-binding protein [Geobacillus thermocatenulatus]
MTVIIRMRDVSWARGERIILRDINWEMNEGEQWAILGLNGSGKTSLLNIVTGYQYPTRGEVEVLGYRFGQASLPEMRRHIGFVSSALDQFHDTLQTETVEDVIVSGKFATIGLYDAVTREDRDQAEALMESFRLQAVKGKRYATLSQGEKRKTLIARALMANPKLLILDEPTVGLDLLAREEVLSLIEQVVSRPCHVLYVTHYIEEIVGSITHVLLLQDGRIAAAGRKEDVLTDERLSAAFRLHMRVHWENGRPWASVHR